MGIPEVWTTMQDFWHTLNASGDLLRQRHKQMTNWMWQNKDDVIMELFKRHPDVVKKVMKYRTY